MKHILVFLLFACFLKGNSQNDGVGTYNFGFNTHTGYVYPHYDFIYSQVNGGIYGVELNYSKTQKKDYWDELYRYPESGVSLFYTTLGNDKVFGRELALTYFFKIKHRKEKKISTFSRIGFGLSYVTERFSYQANYQNLAISSQLNAHFNYRFGLSFKLSNYLSANTGLSFDHYSNANTFSPNYGVNYFTLFCGVNYHLAKGNQENIIIPKNIPKNTYTLYVGLGINRPEYSIKEVAFPMDISAQFNRNFTHKYWLGFGLDLFYNHSMKRELEHLGVSFNPKDAYHLGINITQSYQYRRLKFSIQEGLYFILMNKLYGASYFRAIFEYKINYHFTFRTAIKTHLFNADYPEIGVGYTL